MTVFEVVEFIGGAILLIGIMIVGIAMEELSANWQMSLQLKRQLIVSS